MNYITANSKYEVIVKNIDIKQRFDKLRTKSVSITKEQIIKCREFAIKSIETSDEYLKLVPKEIKDEKLQKEIGLQRVFVEKVAECGFLNYLLSKGIDPEVIQKHKIGIKTAIAKEIHTRLIIDKSEFENKKSRKNYYVGIHLNLEMEDKKDNIKRHLIKNLYDIKRVQIFGYLDSKFISELRYETVKNKMGKKEYKFFNKKAQNYQSKDEYAKLLGSECKWYYLDRVLMIDDLINKIK